MQKRIIMVLVVLLALTAGAFALEESQAAARSHSFAFTANASTTTVILPAQDASLFAGIEGTELSGDEMMMVEGGDGGLILVITIIATAGWATSVITGESPCRKIVVTVVNGVKKIYEQVNTNSANPQQKSVGPQARIKAKT